MKKLKKLLSLGLTASVLAMNAPTALVSAEDTAKDVILYASDYDGNETVQDVRLSVTGAVTYGEVDKEHGRSIKLEALSSGRIGYLSEDSLPKGRYKIAFDYYMDSYDNEIQFRVIGEQNSGVTDATDAHPFVRWKTGKSMTLTLNADWTQLMPSAEAYEVGKWKRVEMSVDTKDREMALRIGGKDYGEYTLFPEVEDLKGFIIWHSVTGSSEKGVWLDNVSFTREAEDKCEYLSPVKISCSVPEGIYGNNFLKDKMPEFDVTYKNRLPYKKTIDVKYTSTNQDGFVVWESTDKIELGANEEITKKVKIEEKHFGLMQLDISYTDELGNVYTDFTQYTLSNRTSDMPNNKRVGVSVHIDRGRGELEPMVGLMKTAGIGNMRGEDMNWGVVETAPGIYADKLPEYQENLLNALDENDIDYLFLFSGYSPYYNVDPTVSTVVADARGYAAAEKYIEHLMKLAKGRINYIEVTNEYHSSHMVPVYNTRADVLVDITRATNKGVKAAGADTKVVAIDEDRWGMYQSGMIPKYFEEMNGEKCYDYISLHPYVADMTSFETGNAIEFFDDVKKSMVENNLPADTPFLITELGWGDANVNYEMDKKTAYTVRCHAFSQAENLVDILFNYTLVDYAQYIDSSAQESSMGICNAYSYGGHYVPYLGKETYVGLAYWNGLMAENEYIGKIEGINNYGQDFGYLFKDRLGRDVVMIGMIEDGSREVSLDLGADTAIVADIYGNEKEVKGVNGKFSFNLQPYEIVYIIGSFNELSDIKVSDPEISFSEADIKMPIDGIVNYTVKIPDGLDADVTIDTNGVIKTADVEKTENGDIKVTFVGNETETDGIMTLNVVSGEDICYTRNINIEYTPSGIVKNYKLENVFGAADKWDVVFDVQNIRQDRSISGTVTIDSTNVIRELPEIAAGETRRIRIPVTEFDNVENVGTFNGLLNFTTGDKLEFSQSEKRIYAAFTKEPPKIDADLSEWNHNIATMYADSTEQMIMLMSGERWNGPDDVSMAIDMCYDLENLYLAFEVTDDVFYQPFDMTSYWKGDSIQFSVGFNVNSANGTGFNVALDPSGETYNYRTAQENNLGGFGGIDAKIHYTDGEQAVKRIGNKTYYEVKIPWHKIDLNPVEIKQGKEVYFGAIVNDNDGNGRKGYMEYASGVGTGANAIAQFYKVYLGK